MSALIHSRWEIRYGVHASDDGSGAIFLGATAGDSFVSKLLGVVGDGVDGCLLSGASLEGARPHWTAPLLTPDTRVYRVSFPRATRSIRCAVGYCEGRATARTNLWIHFVKRHMREKVVIMKEGNYPYPPCPSCDMLIPWVEMNRGTQRQPYVHGGWIGI